MRTPIGSLHQFP